MLVLPYASRRQATLARNALYRRRRSSAAPNNIANTLNSVRTAGLSAGTGVGGSCAKMTLTVQAAVIGPVVYGLAVPGTPPQPLMLLNK